MSGGLFQGSEYIRDARLGLDQAKAVYLGDKKIWPPMKAELTTFSTAGAYTYDIPESCDKVDVILLGGGEAGTNGTAGNGSGGQAGNWTLATLTRGVDIPWSTTQITGTVGAGGASNGANGGSSTASGTGMTTLTGTGGSGNVGATNTTGEGAGTQTYNGQTYVGGGSQSSLNNDGRAPGGGGAGGGFASSGGAGARGQVWFYAYSTAPRPFSPGTPTLSPGPVTFDAAGAGSAVAGGSTSWTHTIGNPTEDGLVVLVYVKVAKAAGGSISAYTRSATYGGVPMTAYLGYNDNNGTDGFMQLFYLFDPPTGAQTVQVTVDNSPTLMVCQSVSYYNVDLIDGAYEPSVIGASGTATTWDADNHSNDASIFALSVLGTVTASSGGTQRYLSSNAAGSLLLRDATGVAAETAYSATRSSGAAYLRMSIYLRSNIYEGSISSNTYSGGTASVTVNSASPAPLTWNTGSIAGSDTNTMIIVGIVIGATDNTGTCTATVTLDGTPMTPIGTPDFVFRDATGGGAFQGLYALMNPGDGVHTIEVTAGGTCLKHGIVGGAVILRGMSTSLTTPTTYNAASGTTAAFTVPSASGQWAVGIVVGGSDFSSRGPGRNFAGADISTTTKYANSVQMYLRPGFTSGTTLFGFIQTASARMTGIGTVFSPLPPP